MAGREPEDGTTPLCIRLFGPIDVRRDGAPLPRLHSRKGLWLLALLTLRHPSTVERDWLAGLLWPDSDETQALSGLRNTLADLRRALGCQAARLYSPTTQTLSLDLTGAEVDVLRFDAAVARGDTPSLEQAAALYRGPLLEGCVEEWVLPEREAREQAYLEALERLAAEAMQREDHAAAERRLRRAVAVDPTRESAQRALMQALAAGGNYAAATQLYRELRLHLHRELNAEPDAETRALYEQIRAEGRRRAEAPAAAPPAVSPASPSAATRGPLTPGAERTVTFLFTDIEGSTRLWEQHGETMREALARHDEILHAAVAAHEGKVFKTVGDGICAVFATAADALAGALSAQRVLQAEEWGVVAPLRVRMALYTGIAEERGEDFVGPPLNRVARLLAAGSGGQILLSSATRELARDRLPEGVSLRELGLHRLPDVPHPEPLFQLVHPDLPQTFPPLTTLGAVPNNLPRQLTSFIGREAEIAEVKRLLSTRCLLTLTGTGGCGKTRLARETAGQMLAEYPDGVWQVELAALSDPALVPQAVASALGLREEPGRRVIETLVEYLRSKSVLLVLDNCEHLVAACAESAEALLQSCEKLRVLATSREALGVAGETTMRVPSLSMPGPKEELMVDGRWLMAGGRSRSHQPSTIDHPPSALLQFEAVQLFAERAGLSQPDFALTAANAPAVAQACRRLDGIPLAIELAAARVKVLTVEQIAARLDDRFRLLTGGSRTALPRHQTLRAAIDWSYELLSEPERLVLCRLAVFAGGFTLEAAEAVCAGGGVDDCEVFDLLARLVDKSLVGAEERDGEARYRLLETIRQYGRDRLMASEEATVVRGRHLGFFLGLAECAEPELEGPHQGEWLSRLDVEHDNLRAALVWAAEAGLLPGGRPDAKAELRLAGALWRFWMVRGYFREGEKWLEPALARGGSADPKPPASARAKAYTGAGSMAWMQSDYSRATALHGEALALYREAGDQRGVAFALNNLGVQAHHQGDYATARALYEESLALSRELGDTSLIAGRLMNLGLVLQDQGVYDRAAALREEGLALAREVGNSYQIAQALYYLGDLEKRQGNYARAASLHEEGLVLCRKLGYNQFIAPMLLGLADVVVEQEDSVQAAALYKEGLALCREFGYKRGIAEALEGLAHVARAQGQPERTARLFGASEALRRAIGAPLDPAARASYHRSVTATRAALGEEAFTAARAEGGALTIEQAVGCALDESAGCPDEPVSI